MKNLFVLAMVLICPAVFAVVSFTVDGELMNTSLQTNHPLGRAAIFSVSLGSETVEAVCLEPMVDACLLLQPNALFTFVASGRVESTGDGDGSGYLVVESFGYVPSTGAKRGS